MNILKGAENNTRILAENNNRLEKMLQHFLVTLPVSQIRRLPAVRLHQMYWEEHIFYDKIQDTFKVCKQLAEMRYYVWM